MYNPLLGADAAPIATDILFCSFRTVNWIMSVSNYRPRETYWGVGLTASLV